MKKVFIIHGFEGKPNGAWRPWLLRELEKLDVYACALPMPTPEKPLSFEWVNEIARQIPAERSEIFLVGHSLGVPAIFNFLQEHPSDSKLGGVLLISGPAKRNADTNSHSYKTLKNFFEREFDYEQIGKQAQKFCVIHGDNDAVVPFEHAQHIAQNLNCPLISVPNGGHLNGSSGFYELPPVLQILQNWLAQS